MVRWLRWCVLVVAGFVAAACGGAANTMAAQTAAPAAATEQADGWTSLFDGQTISHWRGFKQTGGSDGWAVVNAAITRVGAGTDLVSREPYTNFEFAFEWQVPPAGNSGVMFRVTEDLDRTYHTGPEYQVLDNGGHADGRSPLTSAASNYALHAPTRDATRPVGEWNDGRLVANGHHVEHWLNGEKVVEYELGSPEWVALVLASKFNEWPSYGRRPRGHLVLQNHGDAVAFRNLRIRILP